MSAESPPVEPAAALRPALPGDVPLLAAIAMTAILELTGEDYDERQQEAWADAFADEEALAERLADRLTLVATRAGEPVGFIALAENTIIDLLYIRPEVAGEGVATLLCVAIEKLATARGAKSLTVDASDTALAFFQARGYVARQRNTVQRGGEWLGNTTLEKKLTAEMSTPG
ncbi:putative acetyltransferase [Angulomicrobium tetraedrale]|uniref:Putative acetyltransferase n=1 Tax=Ancylobacter tetraedralis TaxID=217068 RepID=A0A839Z005_9HYPH|nr:GNAT family N-acetyltransferase [Ancylobacter tetraedralis]MBB3770094.1 putative acetyltransferase [Ancylobacter tetraedralis]